MEGLLNILPVIESYTQHLCLIFTAAAEHGVEVVVGESPGEDGGAS